MAQEKPKRRTEGKDAARFRVAFGERVRAAREAAGYKTVTSAAEKLGMLRTAYTQIESGRSSPTATTIDHLVRTLGLDPRILFPPEPEKPARKPRVPRDQLSD